MLQTRGKIHDTSDVIGVDVLAPFVVDGRTSVCESKKKQQMLWFVLFLEPEKEGGLGGSMMLERTWPPVEAFRSSSQWTASHVQLPVNVLRFLQHNTG